MKNCPKVFSVLFSFVALFLLFAHPVLSAAPDGLGPWADTVVSSSQANTKGGTPVAVVNPARSNPTSALGVAENDTVDSHFFSLGFGGAITLGFDNGISSGVIIVEATNPGYPAEKANVEVSEDGSTWVGAGTVIQDGEVAKPEGINCAKFVRITDTSNPADFSEDSADAYDVDGVQAKGEACQPPPTPPCSGDNCGCTSVTQKNTTNVSVGAVVVSNTGKNKANNNNGDTSVSTGGATSSLTTAVGGNTNTANAGKCCGKGGNTNVTISNNGPGSNNTVVINKNSKSSGKKK